MAPMAAAPNVVGKAHDETDEMDSLAGHLALLRLQNGRLPSSLERGGFAYTPSIGFSHHPGAWRLEAAERRTSVPHLRNGRGVYGAVRTRLYGVHTREREYPREE